MADEHIVIEGHTLTGRETLEQLRAISGGNEIQGLKAEIERLTAWLETIERLTDEEIGVRFRTSSHKTEEQMAGKSVIYTMLAMPRNLARAALRGDAYEQKPST